VPHRFFYGKPNRLSAINKNNHPWSQVMSFEIVYHISVSTPLRAEHPQLAAATSFIAPPTQRTGIKII
jgi:hypothetical protein